jgi:catechol 1,2-dioxygenase
MRLPPLSAGWAIRGARLLACLPTADTIRGPFYRSRAPWRTRLCPLDEPGERLSISGIVRTSDDCRPIAGATLDIWQTNARGFYSNLFGLQNSSKPGAFNLRGRLQTDGSGCYRFESVVPGRYPLFWPLTRPRHIHVFVTHPDCEPLITQIYFKGDKYNQSDPWWRASLTTRLARTTDAGSGRSICRGTFDITLQPHRSHDHAGK